MRISMSSTALICAITMGPAAAAAQKAPGARHVELIAMSSVESTTRSDVETDATPRPVPSAFQVHDLSRRYVEYRMTQELGEITSSIASEIPSSVASDPNGFVSPTSPIAVPGWMRGTYSVAPAISYAPACTPLAYRPSGFLGRSAEGRRAAYYAMMSAIACEHGIPTGLFDAMIIRESGYNPVATSRKNAFGLAQLMPSTAAGLGVDRYDPAQNMRGGARYLRQQLDRFGQVQLALAAYNAGPGRVRNNMVPRITETQNYVSAIISDWSRLTGGQSSSNPFSSRATGTARVAMVSSF